MAAVGGVTTRTDADLDVFLAPHRAWIDGRAALETLVVEKIAHARAAFEVLVAHHPGEAALHVGLANACALQFESTRADLKPDLNALQTAARHAREAWQLGEHYAEAWATLGFVLERTGERTKALEALHRAVTLERTNWCQWLRLADGSWGGQRLSAATRALELMPDCPHAHVLAATVFIARGILIAAERELDDGIAALPPEGPAPFSAVALHWLKGLLLLARNQQDAALEAFQRELALEPHGHLYARECSANTWYAIGEVHLRRGQRDAAHAAFTEATARVPRHPMALVGLELCGDKPRNGQTGQWPQSLEDAVARAALLVARGKTADAAEMVAFKLATAPPGNAGWTIPIDPMLCVECRPEAWRGVLTKLRARAV